ncbi:chromate resistance protein ChrB [Clostridium carboxidivorans P7]|uniref:ChrB N-terminal domain-containing protein n=2 Tax=Clostridium TaxID=1485 RepID=C6PN14_9CLOT|nr:MULTISPECIES: Chromate resistance protein ChrB [Clostridium]AKN30879.1 chromate resistance protein ChrB [Clostridium carboxidivorans P7]AWI05376.1 chromate resistance protein ChrB [Clostridium drakei]EET89347.1 conserved hypothetical protein [Clostridium carboxidivorans P7]EFG88873.1 ChrB domain family protein [Clostridium carboxidivorans P7]
MSMKFLALTYKVPSNTSKNRVYIWRKIKDIGAVYLQQGVALLPYEERLFEILKDLREEVNNLGGKSTLSELNFISEDDEKCIISEFKKQIDEEYIEFEDNCQRLIYELDRETENGKFKFSELQENEEELKKFQRWYEKITSRDYFHSERKCSSKEMFEKAKARLQEYSHEVYKNDKVHQ